jgi:hypothetical protein
MGGCGAPPSAINVAAPLTLADCISDMPAFDPSTAAALGKRATVANKLTRQTAIVLFTIDICASKPEGNDGAWIVTPRSPEPTLA